MARVLTQNSTLRYVVETALGTPDTTGWQMLQPNTIGAYGAVVKTVERNPISKNRLQLEGTIVDLDSSVEFTSDFTMDHAVDFLEGFMFAKFTGPGLMVGAPFLPTAVTTTGYTVAAGGDLTVGTLIFVKGCATAANNGMKVVTAGSTGTEIHAAGLTAETGLAARNVTVTICGWQGTAGDIVITAAGNITSTTDNFTVKPWSTMAVGQMIYIGDDTSADYHYAVCPSGFARVDTIAAHAITLSHWTVAYAADVGAAKTIRIFFGRHVTNQDVDAANFLERSLQFEAMFENLQNPSGSGAEYQYAKGNYCNEMTLNMPLADKATVTWGFIGTDTAAPVTVRLTGPSTAVSPIMNAAFNTVGDIPWLRISETSGTSRGTYFSSVNLKIMNNVSPEKTLGTLGATFLNYGKFKLQVDATALFTDSQILAAIRANRTMTFDFCLRDDNDGGMFVHMPSVKLTGGKLDLPENESVKINWTAMAIQDATLGTAVGFSLFPYLPF